MLAFVIISILLVMTIPPILRVIDQAQERVQVNNTITRIYDGMTLALTTHWQQTQCRSAPTLNLTNLINDYGVPANVRDKYTPVIAFESAVTPPYNARSFTITLTTNDDNAAHLLNSAVKAQNRWITIEGNKVTLTQPIKTISSMTEHMNTAPQSGCIN